MHRPFMYGDIVEFCGDQATVIANYGNSGRVRLAGCNDIVEWRWVFEGEPVKLIKAAEEK